MLSSTACGCTPSEILGRSFLSICHTDEQTAILQTMQALLMSLWQRGGVDSSAGHPSPGAIPKSVRMLHRVIVGLNSGRACATVAVDSILSVAPATLARSSSETLLLCSRTVVGGYTSGLGTDPGTFGLGICPWSGHGNAA